MPGDRLTALDASFLHLEDEAAHMHVASVMVFDGDPPPYDDLLEAIERRLHLVPRYRQRLASVPFGQGRPKWVDDPHFNMHYHVRATALPPPGSEDQLRALAGRVFSQRLDRDKPLWEIWLVDGLEGGRFAMLSKTHHALVDGVSGVDIATVIFDLEPDPAGAPTIGERWLPGPMPSRSQLLAEALLERATIPREAVRSVWALFRAPRRVVADAAEALGGVGAMAWVGLRRPPLSPYNVRIGPHRRFTWVRAELDGIKAIKNGLGGTVNDVMLTAVAGGLRRHMWRRGDRVDGLELRAMVPVSVRAEAERGALGNRVAAMMAPLPVWCEDPAERMRIVGEAMQGLKESGQAVGARVLTELGGFAPPTVLAQATRLMSRRSIYNLVVTNVPGPQFPLYLMGRELLEIYPMVPLIRSQALGIAIMSYNGRINFGLVGDYDSMPDLDDLSADIAAELEALAKAAGAGRRPARAKAPKSRPREKAEAASKREPAAATAERNGEPQGS